MLADSNSIVITVFIHKTKLYYLVKQVFKRMAFFISYKIFCTTFSNLYSLLYFNRTYRLFFKGCSKLNLIFNECHEKIITLNGTWCLTGHCFQS